jgi:restriction system protein
MKRYYRIILGPKSIYAEECVRGNFIGADLGINQDISKNLPENWREFNQKFIPVWLDGRPDKTKVAAGLSCGMLWTLAKGIKIGDIVLCSTGQGSYHVGEIMDNYSFHPEGVLPHRRTVKWYDQILERESMSEALRNSSGSVGTVCDLSRYAEEIEVLISGYKPQAIIATDSTIEDPAVFALEKHLEDFLVQNWKNTELGKHYDIYEEEGQLIGKQYPSDTVPLDILAISKDKKSLLVVELKRGRASDNVVGQIQRYMGFVKEELAEPNQQVRGVIIALEDDLRIRRALSVTTNIEFYRYQVSFKLFKG